MNLAKHIQYLGLIDNFVEKLVTAKFVIVPTLVGCGQQLKVFEALGRGVPIVCFSSAVPEFIQSIALGVVSVNDDRSFADAISKMWHDVDFYHLVAKGAESFSKIIADKYSYKDSIEKLLKFYMLK